MNDDLSSLLADGHRYAKISPEMLEVFGKQAANMYLDEGVALNEAVVKIASAHDDISPEQVKRIAEFANTATYLALHDKNKTSGAKTSYPQFELADPSRVIQDMSDGARPTVVTQVDREYGMQPLKEKNSSVNDPREDALAEMFGVTKEKTAEADFSAQTAIDEVFAAKDMLVGLRDSLRGSAQQLDDMFKEASAELYEHAKRFVLEEGTMADVFRAVEATGASRTKVAEVLQPIIKGFIQENVRHPDEMKEDLRGLEKVAHRLVNPENRMVKAAGAVVACSQELNTLSEGLASVTEEIEKIDSFIKEKLSHIPFINNKTGLVEHLVNKAGRKFGQVWAGSHPSEVRTFTDSVRKAAASGATSHMHPKTGQVFNPQHFVKTLDS